LAIVLIRLVAAQGRVVLQGEVGVLLRQQVGGGWAAREALRRDLVVGRPAVGLDEAADLVPALARGPQRGVVDRADRVPGGGAVVAVPAAGEHGAGPAIGVTADRHRESQGAAIG